MGQTSARTACWAALVVATAMGCEPAEAPAWPGADPLGGAPCVPKCGLDRCGEEDGCGGRCVCAADASCLSCPLRLVRDPAAGADDSVTLTLDSSAVAGIPLARLAELLIVADRPVELVQVAVGPALASARKRLHRFTDTDLPWQRTADGAFRLLVLSGGVHAEVPPGRWLSLRFAVPEAADEVTFHLVRRPDVLAPVPADLALQATRYDAPLRVPVRALAGAAR